MDASSPAVPDRPDASARVRRARHRRRKSSPRAAGSAPARWQARCTTVAGVMRTWTAMIASGGVAAWIGSGVTVAAAAEEHGLSQRAVEIARPLGFPVTNSMVVTWIVAVVIIVFAQVATRGMQQVPEGRRISWSG